MAKRYASKNKVQSAKHGQSGKPYPDTEFTGSDVQARPSPLKGFPAVVAAAAFIFILALAGSMDNIIEKWTGWLSAVIIILLLFVPKQSLKLKNYITPLFFSVSAYIIWAGVSTFYAASGKFAIFEFSKLLVAFFVYLFVLFFTDRSEAGFKRISYILASAGCFFGVISVDAASAGVLSGLFKSFLGVFTDVYAERGAFEEGIRITGIFGNPNIYAGFMAIAVFLSLYLTVRASDKKNARIASALLAANSLAYLLAFSMGSLFVFLIACLVMVGISEKDKRISLFLLMLETAVLAFIFAFLSMAGLGKTGALSFVPILALALNAFLLYLLDGRLRPALSNKLNSNVKLIVVSVLAIVILISGYTLAAFQISGSMKLNANEGFMRAIYVPGGEYSLEVDSSAPVGVSIESQNRYDLMRHTSVRLYSGTNEQTILFNVPEDSEIVQINFSSPASDTEISKANYTGPKVGNVHLNYPLLPDIIANRVQNLFANENAVQRTIFFEDGIKLFFRSPVIGRGLGGFENGVYAVQDFNYETKYAHNHYIQVLSDLGIVGFLLFLSMLVFSAISVIRSKKKSRSLFAVPALAACLFQIFGQAVTDATWSMGVFLGFAAAILALITIFCSEAIRLKETFNASVFKNTEKIIIAVFAGIFILLLFGNLYTQAQAKAGVKSFGDIERLILLDRFEYNDFKVSYLVNAPKSGDPDVIARADLYAQALMKVESNSLAPYLATYYFETYQDVAAFDAAKRGIKNAGAYPGMWIRLFDIFEEYVDPVGAHTDDAADRLREPKYYTDSVLELYDALLERNSGALEQITLSPYNNTFIGKLLEIRATHLYSIDWAFTAIMTYAFDSECAVDTNQDGIPDNLTLSSGSVQRNQDGLLEVSANTVIDLTLYHKLRGEYAFIIRTKTPQGILISVNGEAQNVLYKDDEAYVTLDLPNNSNKSLSKFTVTFPTAAVIDYITYTTELE